jgi:hypothetical protein
MRGYTPDCEYIPVSRMLEEMVEGAYLRYKSAGWAAPKVCMTVMVVIKPSTYAVNIAVK